MKAILFSVGAIAAAFAIESMLGAKREKEKKAKSEPEMFDANDYHALVS